VLDYVEETRFAAESLFPLIFHERDKVEDLKGVLDKIERRLTELYRVSDFLSLNPDLDDEGIGTAARWEARFDVEPEHIRLSTELDKLKSRIGARRIARAALCGSLLQIAKQGLSIVHQGPKGPKGRLIGTQHLRDVIWKARNQANHFDEGDAHAPVRRCFETLATDLSRPEFRDYNQRSLAFEVFEALRWNSYSDYERDLRSLL